ncbi:MAG: T9SS type A sorting domain-containing protein [bacterium]
MPLFSDPEGDPLSFTAISDDNNIATALISGSTLTTLTVAPVEVGTAMITITAFDRNGNSADTSFGVIVRINQRPVITHTSISPRPSRQPIQVQAEISDDIGIASASLHYRMGGDPNFTRATMTATGNSFQASISSGSVTSRGVEYFIEATDQADLSARFPPNGAFSIVIQINSEAKPTPQPGGDQAIAYRLVSVPFRVSDSSAAAVLADDLGQYSDAVWLLIELAAGQPLSSKSPYFEVSQIGFFTPGKSFFLIVRDPNKTIDAGPGQTIQTGAWFRLALAPGHNFVATPFNFAVPAARLRLKSNGAIALRSYHGVWGTIANEMVPWEGYYFANNSSLPDTLFINPDLSPASGSTDAGKIAGSGWRLRLDARCGPARDSENFAGVAASSHDTWDEADLVEPPPIGEYVSVYFPHREWRKLFDRYSEDMRSLASPNQRWNFVVESSFDDKMVSLQVDGLRDLDPALAVYLVDVELNYKQNLRERVVYEYQARGTGRPRQLSLVAGNAEYVSAETANVEGVPLDYVLEQNFPNPFNPETALRFGLPRASVVNLKIYDLTGREVATVLETAELPAGRHQRVWNGRDAHGRPVASSVYFCRLTVDKHVKTIKLTVMR